MVTRRQVLSGMIGVTAAAGVRGGLLRPSVARAQAMRMKLAHFADEGHPGHLAAKMFAEAVDKRTNGQIKIDIFPNNMLGSPPDGGAGRAPCLRDGPVVVLCGGESPGRRE